MLSVKFTKLRQQEPEYEFKLTDLASAESACYSLSRCLQQDSEDELKKYMHAANKLTSASLQNVPYLLTEFLTCTSSWGVGLILGRYLKYDLYPEFNKDEIGQLMEKLFIPISLVVGVSFQRGTPPHSKSRQKWQECIASLRNRILFVHYRLTVASPQKDDASVASREIAEFVATSCVLMSSLKVQGVRRLQEMHTMANLLVLPWYNLCFSSGKVEVYTNEKVDLPKLWQLNMQSYSKFMPAGKFASPDNGALAEFDAGVVRESLQTLSTLSAPTCPPPLYKLLWLLSVCLGAALVWDATDNLADEVAQSFGVLFVLYAPYVFSMAGGLRSYHLSASNIFWQTYAGGLKRVLHMTWKLLHEEVDR